MILFFSGTGNSRLVAEMLSKHLGDKTVDISELLRSDDEPLPESERVIWVFPVHSWGMPQILVRYLSSAVFPQWFGETGHFMVATCGDDAGCTHDVWRKAMRRHGWTHYGAYTVIMPNTYVALPGFDVDSQSLEQSKLADMPERVRHIARAISVRAKVDDVVKGAVPGLKTNVVYPLFMAALTSPSHFKVDEKRCIGCGRCERRCPLSNVKLSAEHVPTWGKNCTMCLACYHVCPSHAINYGPFTSGKGQYLAPDKLQG